MSDRDGQHDFDFLFGAWKIHNRRLRNPLTGSTAWYEFEGRVTAQPIWGGKANMDVYEGDSPEGRIQGATIRLYNPKTRQWSLYWANAQNGTMEIPVIGEFENGRGEFYDQELYNGRSIFVRFTWTVEGKTGPRWEQAFSADGGKTWETNWVVDFERVDATPPAVDAPDRQRDFDFFFGNWKIHNRRLRDPLTGSTSWYEFDGNVVARPVWGGRANIDEYEGNSPQGRIQGMTFRLYDPKTRQWSIYWANAANGTMDVPMVGEFKDGRGEFYDQEKLNGRSIYVRFIWTPGKDACRWEQAFSDDGGKTWETNWVMDMTRAK